MANGNQRIKDPGIQVLGTAFDRQSGVYHPGPGSSRIPGILDVYIIYDLLERMSIGNKKS